MSKRTRVDCGDYVTVRDTSNGLQLDWKPDGLWYEVDGAWRDWCQCEELHGWIGGMWLHRVTLGDERMLHLRCEQDVRVFSGMFSKPLARYCLGIDWPSVAREYDGIEVAPYVRGPLRLESGMTWYSSWDCSSGCIWRPRGVRLELIEGPLRAREAAGEVPPVLAAIECEEVV